MTTLGLQIFPLNRLNFRVTVQALLDASKSHIMVRGIVQAREYLTWLRVEPP